MSDPPPSLNIGGNAENVTIIVGDDNQATTSNEQFLNSAHSTKERTPDRLPKTFSPVERRRLRQTLNALPLSAFEDLVCDLAIPAGILPNIDTSQHDQRCRALLAWAENTEGIGLAQLESLLIPMIAEQARIAETYLGFVIEGKINKETIAEIKPIIQLLRVVTGDDSIDISFVEDGSIRMVLSGSSEGLKKVQELYASSELEALALPEVEIVQPIDVYPIDNDTPSARKARLVEVLKLRGTLDFLLMSALDSAHDLFSDIEQVISRANISINSRNHDHDLSGDIINARDRASNLSRVFSRISRNLPSDLVDHDLSDLDLSDHDLTRDLVLGSTLTNALDRARDLFNDLDRASDHDLSSNLPSDLFNDLDRARDLTRYIVGLISYLPRDLPRDRDRDYDGPFDLRAPKFADRDFLPGGTFFSRDLNLTDADLSGANLSNINLVGANLTGADLTDADVQGTIFGNNQGLSESAKRDLQKRGAIFQDSPSSDVPNLVRV